ncbi:MAG: InlB B-repeat-containing protein, partial [Oscillospiraceae bacterium]|nr:InlB B-repeat-containing protein [Oscillospiraceae bacterium]
DFTVTIDGDVAPENHDIKWNLNHSEIPATSTSVADGAAVVPPEVVERTGYNFLGWFDNAAGTGTAVDFTDLVATESVEYFAKWEIKTYVVTFNPGEGTLVTPSEGTRSVEHGSAVGEFPEVTRAGFNLTGWTTDGTPVDANTIVTAAVTFTANWVDESVTLYPITWNYNYSGSPDSLVVDVAEYAEISLPSEPTREGFVFAGWFDNAEGAGTAVEFTGLVATEAKEYFAKWVAQYSVTWDLNYIGTPPAVETVINHGDNIAAPTPAPTRSGYEFLGWFVNAEGTGDAVVFPVLAVGDRTFYAKWEITTTQSDGLEVQLMARTAWESDPDGDGSTGAERLLKGETVNIEQNGPGTITITAPSSTLGGRAFTGIAIRSESSTPGASGNQWDNKGDAEEAHENYKDAVITIDSVTVTGATATIGLQNNEELELVSSWGTASTNPFLNYVDVQLWNTYHEPNNRIVAPGGGLDTAFTDGGTEQNGWVHNTAPGVVFPTGTATITVNFTVTGIVGGGNYQPPATCDVCDSTECENRACVPAGSLPVRLMARNATGSGTIFKGPAVMIKDDGAYSAEVTFPGTLQQFVNFALRAPGTSWGDDGDEKGTAVTAPAAFGDATISVTKITANAGLNNLGLEDVLNLPLVATDNDLAGYADVQFWNAWGEPKAVTGVTTEDVWGGTGLNIPASTNKITIEFTISLDGAGTCDDGTCGNAICPTCFCQSHTWAANAVCGTVCAHAKCDVALTDCQQSGCEICFDPDACPTCNQLDCNGCVDVVLQTRPIWLSGGAFGTETGWGLYQDSDVLRIAKDDQDKTYTLTVDVKRRHEDCDDMCCILDMITDLKIAQKGTKMGGQDELINPGNANRDVDGPFREVGVTFNEIKVNDTVVDLIDHYMLPWFVARDDDAECLGDTCMTGVPNGCTPNDFWCPRDGHAGFVSAPVWNAWWKPHQLLQTGGDSPLALETRSGSNNANVLLANEEKLADDILSFTVTFTLCFDDERCEDCNGCLKENCDDCAGCTCEDFCGLCGCAQCFQGDTNDKHGIAFCADPLCSICYVCTSESGAKCRKFSCINCNPKQEFAALGSVRGEVDEDGNPVADIFDVLEILKFIVGMNSTITDGRTDSEGNVIITAAEARRVATLSDNANSQEEPEPNIFCVLEVLKYIVGMSSVIDGESIALPPSAAV